MKPLAVHGGAAADLFAACVVAWVGFEVALAIRDRGRGWSDWTIVAISLGLGGGLALAQLASRRAEALALPGPGWWPVVLGVVIFALGLGLRAWAVHALGQFFKLSVVVQTDHRVVDTGPYSLIRHPSYTGLLMIELGLGISLGSWLSIPACFLPALLVLGIRIELEERVLARELGEPYRAYMARTKRLIPGVW